MTAYEMAIKANRYLIQDGELAPSQKAYIARRLLEARTPPEQAQRFYRAVRCPGNLDREGRRMYPAYYIPPSPGGKRLKTIMGQTPKTQLFAANYYELEILRLLCLLAPGLPEVEEMREGALARLKTTCFGSGDDGVGECFDASLAVLRFLAAAAPEETGWIEGRLNNFERHYGEKKRPWFCLWYYWLCLSELPFSMAGPRASPYLPEMLKWLKHKGMVMHSEHDVAVHPTLMYLLRNILRRYPEYAYIGARRPYIREKDGRICFDMAAEAGG